MTIDITPRLTVGAQLIQSYGAEGFMIAGVRYDTSVLVSPERTQPLEATFETLSVDTLLALLPQDTEVLLIGTGHRHQPMQVLRAALKAHGIASDTMDTGAACRTYNILLSEGRRVSAALMILSS